VQATFDELLNLARHVLVGIELAVLLLVLLDVHGVQVGLSHETGLDRLKAFVREGQEHAVHRDVVTRGTTARQLALNVHVQRARHVTDGHLRRVFLNAHVLKLDELAAARLLRELTATRGLGTVGTLMQRNVDALRDSLINLEAAVLAGVGRYLQQWLHFAAPRHHTAHTHQLTDVTRSYFAQGHFSHLARCDEIEFTGGRRSSLARDITKKGNTH
jgi:hypothetical protein